MKAKVYSPEVISNQPKSTKVLITVQQGVLECVMPLKQNGMPRYTVDYLLYGLFVEGCCGVIDKGKITVTQNVTAALDYILNNTKYEVIGSPKLFDKPMITSTFSDDEMFPHQKVGVTFLYNRSRALLADDMGLGKTYQALIAAQQIMIDGECSQLLVICPVSLCDNWWREMAKWQTGFSKENASIIPYSQVHKDFEIKPGTIVIMDEVHYCKHVTSKRTRAIIDKVLNYRKEIVRLWLMTGTPVTRDNADLWPLCFLMDHALARSYSPIRMASMKNERNAIIAGAMKTHMLMRRRKNALTSQRKSSRKSRSTLVPSLIIRSSR
jgi:hypothetical protein